MPVSPSSFAASRLPAISRSALASFLPPYRTSSCRGSRLANLVIGPSIPSGPHFHRFQSTSALRMEQVNTTARLAGLRKLMGEHKVDVYIIPSEDSHSSEYIAPCDARREFISGFTGSAGTAVVTHDKAALATDGRYFNQASKQLDDNWLLLKQGIQDVPTWQEWSAEQAEGGKVVGVDPTLLTSGIAKKLSEKIQKSGGKELVPVSENLVDGVWGSEKPARPAEPVIVLDEKYAGKSVSAKLAELRKELEKKKGLGFVVSMLDEIAWLFNLRGNDIPYNPVFFSYAVITPDEAMLYIDSSKLSDECQAFLAENQVSIKPYKDIFSDAATLGETAKANGAKSGENKKFLIANRASWALKRALGGDDMVEEMRSPLADAKAVKNETEMAGMRACHIRDGAALIEYFAWLEDQLVNKKAKIDEVQAADKLETCRAKQKDFVGLSFPTISSTGPNAAVIHYKPEAGSCSTIDPEAVYLCDSGAQFLDGTTDVTRTVHFGTPTKAEIEAYTLVLKGNIALDKAVFPKGTTGFALDSMARQHLWKYGLDYRHGTGHGVGSYLNVHEGPIGIGTRVQYSEVALSPGNVISNEPGFYEDGSYGIRIENIVMVKEAQTKYSFGDKPYLGFEHVTMVPYCRKLIDVSLLTAEEKKWLNESHRDILQKTQSFFANDSLTMDWLERETAPF
ncbi:aminopeptidase-like protein [Xylariomycetidae sp. FL0641]|nr:aminopeptidase-like protein [Xylariomycetidae sp. FL0641]